MYEYTKKNQDALIDEVHDERKNRNDIQTAMQNGVRIII